MFIIYEGRYWDATWQINMLLEWIILLTLVDCSLKCFTALGNWLKLSKTITNLFFLIIDKQVNYHLNDSAVGFFLN